MFMEVAEVKRLNEMFEEHVPMSGPAKTVGGEIVRAMSRIGYRWYNDGDALGVGYGNETCNAAGRYLMMRCGKDVDEAVRSIWGCVSEPMYDVGLGALVKCVVDYLEESPWLFELENVEDMWQFGEDSDDDWEEEDSDDDWEEDSDDWGGEDEG